MNLFGLTKDGQEVYSFELENKNGVKLTVITYGATVTSLEIPLKNGKTVDVVLGFDTLEDYVNSYNLPSPPYMGSAIGRYAGRISNSCFKLNTKTIHLYPNNNNHSLHGGKIGFGQKIWKLKEYVTDLNPSLTLSYLSVDNEENYPGEVSIDLTYTITENNDFKVEYNAHTNQDTILNLTHHSYFNLAGYQSTMENQLLQINSNKIVETTDENIPTGNFVSLNNHLFDFNNAKEVPTKIDSTFVLEDQNQKAASLFNTSNQLQMEVYTNQPGLHVYVGGNCFDTIQGKNNTSFHPYSGICFETQNFPDAPNHENFPNAILKKGENYNHLTTYSFKG